MLFLTLKLQGYLLYTTALSSCSCENKKRQVIDKFESFSNPHHPLSATTINLTGITDDMVIMHQKSKTSLNDFHDWIGDSILVAHNASFDMGFLYVGYKKCGLEKTIHPVIDTLELSRFLHPEMKNHRLNTMAKKFNIDLTQHHRAIYDAEATGELLLNLLKEAEEKGIHYHDEFNHQYG